MTMKGDNTYMKKITAYERDELSVNITDKPKEKTNKSFMQLYISHIDYIIQLTDKSPTAVKILLLMFKFAEANNTVMLKVKTIMEMLHIKREATVKESLKILREDGYVTTYKVGVNLFYFINPHIASSCDARYRHKIILAYNDKARNCDQHELTDLDTDVVDTSIYNKEDGLKLRIAFYKDHKELQKPTLEENIEMDKLQEEIEDYEEMGYINNYGEVTKKFLEEQEEHLKQHTQEFPPQEDDPFGLFGNNGNKER